MDLSPLAQSLERKAFKALFCAQLITHRRLLCGAAGRIGSRLRARAVSRTLAGGHPRELSEGLLLLHLAD